MVRRFIRYLVGTIDYTLVLKPWTLSSDGSLELSVYVDSDWGSCPLSRKSTSGIAISVGDSCCHCLSKTQGSVSLSSCEAELYALCSGACEAISMKQFLIEAGWALSVPIVLYSDSQSAIAVASRAGLSKQTKHIALKYFFLQSLPSEGLIRIKKVLGLDNHSDILTKAIDKGTLEKHLEAMNLQGPVALDVSAVSFVPLYRKPKSLKSRRVPLSDWSQSELDVWF